MLEISEDLRIFDLCLKVKVCDDFGRRILILVLLRIVPVRQIEKHIRRAAFDAADLRFLQTKPRTDL